MKKIVLFVDDPVAREEIQRVLADQNDLAVESTQDPLAHLDGCKTVVLTDLPGSNLDFLQRWDEATETTLASIVVITRPQNENLAVQALRQGAISYVPQRLLESELRKTLDSVFSVLQTRDNRQRILECMRFWRNEFVLENDNSLIGPLVRYLQESTGRLGLFCQPGEETRMGIALEEALLNSMYHGNLEVPSELREDDDSKFYELVETRRREEPYCHRRIVVNSELTREQAVFTIRDEGPGFDVTKIPDPTDPNNVEKVSGRGMLLMRTFMDSVEYNATGNQVTLVKRKQVCSEASLAE